MTTWATQEYCTAGTGLTMRSSKCTEWVMPLAMENTTRTMLLLPALLGVQPSVKVRI